MKLKNLQTKFLGRNCYYYEKIDSTQKEIWRRIDKNIENGCLIIAELQTDGIGTHGRKWYTDQKNNIAFSFYLNTDCEIKVLDGITNQIAEILKEIFYRLYKIYLDIKLPNDLYYKGKKIGGILTESRVYKKNIRFLVIGIGINTSQTVFNEEITDIATSIKKEFDIDINVNDVITEFCNCFEKEILERLGK